MANETSPLPADNSGARYILLCYGMDHQRCSRNSPCCQDVTGNMMCNIQKLEQCAVGNHTDCHRSSFCKRGFIANPFNDPDVLVQFLLRIDGKKRTRVGFQMFKSADPSEHIGRLSDAQRSEYYDKVFAFWKPQTQLTETALNVMFDCFAFNM